MTGLEVGLASLVAILVLIWVGVYVPVALGLVSFVGVWVMRGNIEVAEQLLVIAAAETLREIVFGVIPLFVLMGLLVSVSDLGRDSYRVAHQLFRRVRGGLGIATVAANAVFAAITGVSIASAAVFTRVSVPEMLRFGYKPRFAVGVVAGSSVLGMLIPPSVLLIIYALVVEESVGAMFIAGVIPGILLSVAFCVLILAMTWLTPNFVGGLDQARARGETTETSEEDLPPGKAALLLMPVLGLIVIVLGGIYGGVFTPTEAGAAGAAAVLVISLLRRKLDLPKFWQVLVETGHITASILFLVVAATMYSRMLGVTALPTQFSGWMAGLDAGFYGVLALYVVVLLLMGTILDSVSIILIVVPLFLPLIEPFNVNLVWFGIVTVIAVEVGLLTPPLGLACYVIQSTLDDPRITLYDIFAGAAPFALAMLVVLIAVIAEPQLSLFLLQKG
jgi:tripartite ATP-independent transporter DctM subunit